MKRWIQFSKCSITCQNWGKTGRSFLIEFWHSIDGLMQDCSNSIANTMELLQCCTKPSICHVRCDVCAVLFVSNTEICSLVTLYVKSRLLKLSSLSIILPLTPVNPVMSVCSIQLVQNRVPDIYRCTTPALKGIILNPLPLDKVAVISQTTFSNAFSWMKSFIFRLKFHWSLFQSVQHWLR